MKENTVICEDNLKVIMDMDDTCIDLVYMDPPFNTKREFDDFLDFFTEQDKKECHDLIIDKCYDEYNKYDIDEVDTPYQTLNSILSGLKFLLKEDEFLINYLYFMGVRILEIHRVLKDTGSIYLHCDYRVSPYLRILLDKIFGIKNFKNEIAWCYTGASQTSKKFPQKHDTILFYTKSSESTFNKEDIRIPYTNTKTGIFITQKGKFFGDAEHDSEKLKDIEERGKVPESWWADIHILNGKNKEMTGYSTQKPLKLLTRIIEASSNKDDLVLDPFCGSGTTLVACKTLKRKYIGIDKNQDAVNISINRLDNIAFPFL